jgi:hypothetical protein
MLAADSFRALGAAGILLAASNPAWAGDPAPPACFDEDVLHHVREQFEIYGPRSSSREYFGFIYRKGDRIDSAVTRGFDCRGQTDCVVNTAFALARIPKGAKVLGEWHTHPGFQESDTLTPEDVTGAQANRHVRCYTAFYSNPDGDIYRWTLDAPTVPAAMASRIRVGNYRDPDRRADSDPANHSRVADAAIIAAPGFPGTSCLSTNTSVRTAATATRYCKKSPTSP